MSNTTTHHHTPNTRHWRRRFAVGTLSISSLLAALSAVAYHSFVNLPA